MKSFLNLDYTSLPRPKKNTSIAWWSPFTVFSHQQRCAGRDTARLWSFSVYFSVFKQTEYVEDPLHGKGNSDSISVIWEWHYRVLHHDMLWLYISTQKGISLMTHQDWLDTSEHWGDCLINKASISSAFHVEFTVRWACIWVALIGCLVDQFLIPQAVCQMVYGVLWFMLTLGEVVCVQLAFKCKVLLQFYVFVQVLYV